MLARLVKLLVEMRGELDITRDVKLSSCSVSAHGELVAAPWTELVDLGAQRLEAVVKAVHFRGGHSVILMRVGIMVSTVNA